MWRLEGSFQESILSLPGTELGWSGYSVVLMEAKGWSAGDSESELVPG